MSARIVPPRDLVVAGLRLAGAGVLIAAEDGDDLVVTWTTPVADRLLGLDREAAIGLQLDQVVVQPLQSGPDAADVTALDPLVRTLQGAVDVSLRPVGRADGEEGRERPAGPPTSVRLTATRVSDRAVAWWVVALTEIDERVRADALLRESEARFRTLAAQAPIGIIVSDVGLRLGFVNDRALALWDRPLGVMRSPAWLDAVLPEDRELVITALAGVLAGGEADVPLRIELSDGRTRSLHLRAAPVQLHGRGAGFIGSLEDITIQRTHEEALRHAALHDPLTGLPNRSLLDKALEAAVNRRRQGDGAGALLFFDLDDFKGINDTLGHAAGDQALVAVAGRLAAALRDDDLLVRFGGDEFVVVCRRVDDADVAVAVAERIRSQLIDPITVGGTEVHIDVSVGVAMLDSGDVSPHQLLRDADAAMYQAKRTGRGRVVVFQDQVRQQAADLARLVQGLRDALVAEDGLSLRWQPVVDLADRSVVAVEALVRWHHPERGELSADVLLDVAESHGLLPALGDRVLDLACRQAVGWATSLPALAAVPICVNVARQQLHEDMVDVVATALLRTGLPAARLLLDVPEAALVADPARTAEVRTRLADVGVRIAVDDFGAGIGSVTSLVETGPALVKVDRHVVAAAVGGGAAAQLLGAISRIGRDLDLPVVAEGLETAAQLAAAADAGCRMGQGYLLCPPVAGDDLAEAIEDLGSRW